MIKLYNADCLDVLRRLKPGSVDAVVTDPPAGIGFMGKSWDSSRGGRDQWAAWLASALAECLRVARPGSHLLCWALPRTSHWTGTAIEDAGWIIEDRITHHFGNGFPKHKSKLKPATEDWWLATKPGGKKWLGVDACRVGVDEVPTRGKASGASAFGNAIPDFTGSHKWNGCNPSIHRGRWPANLVLSHHPECNGECVEGCPIRLMGEQSGQRQPGARPAKRGAGTNGYHGWPGGTNDGIRIEMDSGTAARFFPNFDADPFVYQAKASRRDRNEGCEGMEAVVRPITSGHGLGPINTSKATQGGVRENRPTANHHPTVKSTALMSWLCRLACPPGGVILDPFMGSGSTGKAAILEGFSFAGIERDPSYFKIARRRIRDAEKAARHVA